MINFLIYVIIGLLAGILSGLFGIGGGVIIVPALIYLCGFSQLKAQGTSLAILLPPVGLAAFWVYYKNGNVDIKSGIIICVMVFLGAMLGGKLAQQADPQLLRKLFAIFMFGISIKMFLGK